MDLTLFRPSAEAEPDLARTRLARRFRERALERGFRAEQAARAAIGVRDLADAGLVLLAAGTAASLALARGRALPLAALLVAAGTLAGFRVLAPRAGRRFRDLLPVAFGVGLTLLAVASPLLMARGGLEPMAARYGYAGLMLASIVLFLLLRLRPMRAAAINAGGILLYAAVVPRVAGLPPADRALHLALALLAMGACGAAGIAVERLARDGFAQRKLLAWREAEMSREQTRSESLLLNVMPPSIAERLKAGESPLADAHPAVTVLFADIVGFTPLADRLPAAELVVLLDRLFTTFDRLASEQGIEKIKTIGDAYMAVAGVPEPRADHVSAAAALALRMQEHARTVSAEMEIPLQLRIGLDSGPAVAGVIGRRKFAYDLWGEVVNMAARMESHGEPGRIQVTEAVAALLPSSFRLEERGVIPVKGAGEMRTFWLG